ncbi:MAG TPA: cupin domain-containing protein [Clostridia bacterium]|nr:cupin domain-containing protein [Clostridia bacterium]
MVEKKYEFTLTDDKIIERIISDEHADVNHMVLPKGEALPEHYSNSNVYMVVIRGQVTLKLNDQDAHAYPKGSILNIPYKTKMNVSNQDEEILEFFVVKAPSPKTFRK